MEVNMKNILCNDPPESTNDTLLNYLYTIYYFLENYHLLLNHKIKLIGKTCHGVQTRNFHNYCFYNYLLYYVKLYPTKRLVYSNCIITGIVYPINIIQIMLNYILQTSKKWNLAVDENQKQERIYFHPRHKSPIRSTSQQEVCSQQLQSTGIRLIFISCNVTDQKGDRRPSLRLLEVKY